MQMKSIQLTSRETDRKVVMGSSCMVGRCGLICCWIVGTFVLYLLSQGPIYAVPDRWLPPRGPRLVEVIYRPAEWAERLMPDPIDNAYRWYLNQWYKAFNRE
jgi:hypothetical protein